MSKAPSTPKETMSEHKLSTLQRHGSHLYTADPERRLIARFCYEGDDIDEQYHAALAAAPDLLHALENMTTLFQMSLLCTTPEIAKDGMEEVRAARAVIAKALGKNQ